MKSACAAPLTQGSSGSHTGHGDTTAMHIIFAYFIIIVAYILHIMCSSYKTEKRKKLKERERERERGGEWISH